MHFFNGKSVYFTKFILEDLFATKSYRDTERECLHWLTPQMAGMAEMAVAVSGQSQDRGSQSVSPLWLAEAQPPGPSATAFPDPSVRS